MFEIKINNLGKIIQGDNKGWFIKIIDDRKISGGFLILISPNKDFLEEAYDNWVLNYEELKNHFIESKWIIQWQDCER
jgi:hypothetical protein